MINEVKMPPLHCEWCGRAIEFINVCGSFYWVSAKERAAECDVSDDGWHGPACECASVRLAKFYGWDRRQTSCPAHPPEIPSAGYLQHGGAT